MRPEYFFKKRLKRSHRAAEDQPIRGAGHTLFGLSQDLVKSPHGPVAVLTFVAFGCD